MLEDWVDVEVDTRGTGSSGSSPAARRTPDLAYGVRSGRSAGAEPARETAGGLLYGRPPDAASGATFRRRPSLIWRGVYCVLLAAALLVLLLEEPPKWASELSFGIDGTGDAARSVVEGRFREVGDSLVQRASRLSREAPGSVDDQVFSGANVLTRAVWRAAPLLAATDDLGEPWRITVHHSGGGVLTAEDLAGTTRILRAIQRDHQERRRWVDIGYHYIVDRAGRVWEGRPARWIGAHAGSSGANEGNLGILVLGNFDEQSPSGAQTESLTLLVEMLRGRHQIARASVFTHGEIRATHGMAATDCPGRDLAEWVDAYRRGAAERPRGRGPIGD